MADSTTAAQLIASAPDAHAALLGGWLTPIIILACGVVLGWIADRVFIARLRALASRTAWGADDLILGSLRGVTFLWSILIALTIAQRNAPILAANQEMLASAIHVAWIASFTVIAARLVGGLVNKAMERGGLQGTATIATISAKSLIFALGFLIALQTIGIQIMPILGALGVGGLAVALALQDTLANLFAGLHIIASQRLRPGDQVRLDNGDEGAISEITWRYTTLRTPTGSLIVIPNSKLSTAAVTNYSLPTGHIVLLVGVEVAYGSDLERVERVTLDTIRSSVGALLSDGEPLVRFQAFAANGIAVQCAIPVRSWADQGLARHRFIAALHARFAAEHISIPFPTRTIIHG